MSRSSYTASERRGIIVIAILALLFIGSGVTLSLCGRPRELKKEIPVVIEHPEMVDSLAMSVREETAGKKKKERKKSGINSSVSKEKKTYRRRSPLDEPV